MISFFNEAMIFSKSYSELLENFIQHNSTFITESVVTNRLIDFENMQEFMSKLYRGYQIFFAKIKQIKNEFMYKKRVNILIKTLYKLPKDTQIKLPNCEAWGIDLINYFREIVPIMRKICSFSFEDWMENNEPGKTIDILIKLGEKNRALMTNDLDQIKSYSLDRAIIIISNLCNDTTLYSVGTKYENELKDTMTYVNDMVLNYMQTMLKEGMLATNNGKDISYSSDTGSGKGTAIIVSLQRELNSQYQFITDRINKFSWFVYELIHIVVDEGLYKQDIEKGLDNLFHEKLNKLVAKFNSRKLDYASKDLITTALDTTDMRYKKDRSTDLTAYLRSKYNIRNREFTTYYHWRGMK